MASGLSWFKFYCDAHDHPKVRSLDNRQFRLLVYIWSRAQRSTKPGVVMHTTPQALLEGSGAEDGEAGRSAENDLAVLEDRALVKVEPDHPNVTGDRNMPVTCTVTVHDWTDYNGRKPSEAPAAVAERVRRFRERKRAELDSLKRVTNADVTPTEKELEEEREDLDHVRRGDPAARTILEPWPRTILEELRIALGRQLETNDKAWAEWISDTARKFPLQQRVNAARAFLDRPKNGQTFSLGYVFAMIRDRAGANTGSNGAAEPEDDGRAKAQAAIAASRARIAERMASSKNRNVKH